MNYFICYDITDNRRRDKLSKCLLRLGWKRVQKSVFYGRGFDARELENTLEEASGLLLEADGDSLLLIKIKPEDIDKVSVLGENKAWEEAKTIKGSKII